MKPIRVVFFKASGGERPSLRWLNELPESAYLKGVARIKRLALLGHELRRPEADYLGNGIYELRWRLGRVNYRLLYFFHGPICAVLAHGLTKESRVPQRDIAIALERKRLFAVSPEQHTHIAELS